MGRQNDDALLANGLTLLRHEGCGTLPSAARVVPNPVRSLLRSLRARGDAHRADSIRLDIGPHLAVNSITTGCRICQGGSRPPFQQPSALALVAQWIEHRFPKPCVEVRFL